jgi:hypothetical protein
MNAKRAARASWAALVAFSCSPANVASPPDGGSVTGACADYADARCSQLQNCSATAMEIRYGDEATCRTLFSTFCENSILAPNSGWTPAGAEACAQVVGTQWSCSDYIFNQNPPAACQRPTGVILDGQDCAVASQCQSGYCSVKPGMACGSCGPYPSAGDDCTDSTECGPSLACAQGMVCADYAGLGSSCGPLQPCNAGLGCVGATATQSGSCELAVTASGTPCTYPEPGCDLYGSGLTCNAQTQTCETALIAADGRACGIVANGEDFCASSGTCVAGACIAGVGVGVACDLVNGPPCIGPGFLRCVVTSEGGTSGICQYPSAANCP